MRGDQPDRREGWPTGAASGCLPELIEGNEANSERVSAYDGL